MRWLTVLALFTLLGQGPASQSPNAADIAADIEAQLKAARVPGAAFAIVAGDVRLARGFGIASADAATTLDANTLVHIGSLTKVFTALAVVQSLESRKLPLETRVGPYVAGLNTRAAAATFHHLLSQTSGLHDRAGADGASDETALAQAARELTAADFLLPAGTVFSYSNPGYALAGAALEGLDKRPFADSMRALVFTPLGMSKSTLRPSVATGAPHALGHRLDGDKVAIVRSVANDTRLWPAGYMWSNANDISRALFALLHQGRIDGKQAISASAIARVMTPHTPMPNVFVGGHYGYGLMIARDRGVLMYEHGGTLPGFSSIMRFAPQPGIGIVILSNLDNAPLRRIAQNAVAKALALPDLAPPPRSDTPVTPDEMKEMLGVYRNRGTAELAVRDNRVVLILDDGPALLVTRLEPNRYLARAAPNAPGPEFVLEPARGNARAYLHFALWAYPRSP
jgi:CubicO group peptidase (beta-lactamase class C family)